MYRSWLILVAVALAGALFAPVRFAAGHSEYDHSVPNDGQVVTIKPTQVDVYFTEDLLPSSPGDINVLDPFGYEVDNNDVTLDPGDHTHLTVTLHSSLNYGTYTVEWVSTADDGDSEEGTFHFAYHTVSLGGVADPIGGGQSRSASWLIALGAAAAALGLFGSGVVFARRRG